MAGLQEILDARKKREEEFVKQVMSGDRTIATNGGKEITFAQAAEIYGNVGTWAVNTFAHNTAISITHRWRDVAVRAGSANLASTEGGTPTQRKVTETTRTNTCQIFSGRVQVSGSAQKEASNGVYGPENDEISRQTTLEMAGILKDVEKQTWLGTEVAESSNPDARRFKGLIGTVGTWNGLIQTNRDECAANYGTHALSASIINQFLAKIYAQDTGVFPDTLVVSGKTAIKLMSLSNTNNFVYTVDDLARIPEIGFPAGTPVVPWFSPFGPLKVVIHPMCADTATDANSWLAAINLSHVKFSDFRTLFTQPVAQSGDWVGTDIIAELSLECAIEPAHGILYHFDPTS